MGASDKATLIFSTWERQTFPQRRIFFPKNDFLYQFIATAHVGEYSIFFRCKDFSVRLLGRFHFMNKNVYLAMLIFCSCRSRRYGREQLFCPIKIYSNTSDEMQKYYTFKRVFLQYKTSAIQYFFTAPEMFQYSVRHGLRRSAKVFKFVYFLIGGCFNDTKTFRI